MHVIGGGLAGSEAAWQIAARGVPVILHEMRPVRATAVHKTDALAELVCSNSFRSDDHEHNAVGLLHEEMRRLGSLVMRAADAHQVPAGGALAVDRDGFSAAITAALDGASAGRRSRARRSPACRRRTGTASSSPPARSPRRRWRRRSAQRTGEDALAFFDAIAPIVHRDSIDLGVAWFQSRYDKEGPGGSGADYINCPLTREQYGAFVDALIAGDKVAFHEWEGTPYFDGCLPIEVMAERGRETLAPRPDEAVRPHQSARTGRSRPTPSCSCARTTSSARCSTWWASRPSCGTASRRASSAPFPGLEKAEFARLGGLHRNTYLNSPQLLDETLRLKAEPRLRFAGQITGCEGYVESAAMGLMAGRFAAAERLGEALAPPPPTTAHGALLGHITGGHVETIDAGPRSYQPMNVNFGLFPPLTRGARQGRRRQAAARHRQGAGEEARALPPRARRPRRNGPLARTTRSRPNDIVVAKELGLSGT